MLSKINFILADQITKMRIPGYESQPGADPTAKAQGSQLWFIWHSWLGVLSGLLLFIVCWGGTFATISYELDWLFNPALQVQAIGETGSLEDIYQSVADTYPNSSIQTVYSPRYSNFAAEVSIRDEENQAKRIYVDPYTLKITGEAPRLNIQRYLRDFHRRLFTGSFGFYLICLSSIPLIGSLITSLVFYKRWWRRFFEFKSARTVRTFISNLHRLVGLWALWFVVLISFTGAWYLFERVRSLHIDDIFSYSDVGGASIVPIPIQAYSSSSALSFNELLAIVRETRPDIEIAYISLNRGGYFYVVGQTDNVLVRNRANKIYLVPQSGEIVYNQYGEDLSAYWYWSNMADPLHFGDFAGLASKFIWFAFGLILSFLSLSGVWLFAKRLGRSKKLKTKAFSTLAALISFCCWFLFNAPEPFLVASAAQFSLAPQIPIGTKLFLYSWLFVTAIISLSWVYLVFINSRKNWSK